MYTNLRNSLTFSSRNQVHSSEQMQAPNHKEKTRVLAHRFQNNVKGKKRKSVYQEELLTCYLTGVDCTVPDKTHNNQNLK